MTVPAGNTPLSRDKVTVRVSETFLSMQGEGPSAGQRAVFLRLAGCNLACAWCDTRYSWDWHRYDRQASTRECDAEVLAADLARLADPHTRLLVLTGGEPLLQQPAMAGLLDSLYKTAPHIRCEVETNGTVLPAPALTERVHRYVVSPKLAHSGVPSRSRWRPDTLAAFAAQPQSVLKIVAAGVDDLREAEVIAAAAGFAPHRVWIMPLADAADSMLAGARALAGPALDAGFNLALRQHLLLWGNTPGK